MFINTSLFIWDNSTTFLNMYTLFLTFCILMHLKAINKITMRNSQR